MSCGTKQGVSRGIPKRAYTAPANYFKKILASPVVAFATDQLQKQNQKQYATVFYLRGLSPFPKTPQMKIWSQLDKVNLA